MGLAVQLWDYRLSPSPPAGYRDASLTLVLKGEGINPQLLAHPRVCIWPDAFGRDPTAEVLLRAYDRVYTGAYEHPPGVQFLPLGFDDALHVSFNSERSPGAIFVGTATERKAKFLRAIQPNAIFGNGWGDGVYPVYGSELVQVLNQYLLAVNVHRDNMGVTRRLFEMIACGPTITDLVPGVEEVLGPVALEMGFHTPQEGAELKTSFLSHPDVLMAVWHKARAAIQPYTYQAAVRRIVQDAQGQASA